MLNSCPGPHSFQLDTPIEMEGPLTRRNSPVLFSFGCGRRAANGKSFSNSVQTSSCNVFKKPRSAMRSESSAYPGAAMNAMTISSPPSLMATQVLPSLWASKTLACFARIRHVVIMAASPWAWDHLLFITYVLNDTVTILFLVFRLLADLRGHA